MHQPTTPERPESAVLAAPPIDDLVRVAAHFAERADLECAGFTFGVRHPAAGDVAAVRITTHYQVGLVVKVTEPNATIEYTTRAAIADAASPQTTWTEPLRMTRTARIADIAVRTSIHAPATVDRETDHNGKCIGCGVHGSERCYSFCPFETGLIGVATVLRAALRRQAQHPAGVGYSIRGAIFAAAVDLAGYARAQELTDRALVVLTGVLVDQFGPKAEPIRTQVVYRHGLFASREEIGRSLYAAAARHDGIEFNPDEFGELAR